MRMPPPATDSTASPPPLNVTNLNFAPGASFSSAWMTMRPEPSGLVMAQTMVSGCFYAASARSLSVL